MYGKVSRNACVNSKGHSPLVLRRLRVATHEKSLNNEFQGGAFCARQAGFDFTWTTDIRVKHLHSSPASCFSVFHGNHTLLTLPHTHHKADNHILPSSPFLSGSRSSRGFRESWNKMKDVSWQSEMSTCPKFRNHRFLDESRRLLGGNAKKDKVKLIFCPFAETVWSACHFLAAPSQSLQTKDSRRLSTQSLQTVSKTEEKHAFFPCALPLCFPWCQIFRFHNPLLKYLPQKHFPEFQAHGTKAHFPW